MRLLLLNTGPIATLSSHNVETPLTGEDMSDKESLCLEGGQGILVNEGTVQKISQSQELLHEYGKQEDSNLRVYDCKGKAIIPGFVDCHTHLVWGGDRANEMQLRHSGLTYTDIAEKGGGIQKTVDFTRSMPSAILVQLAEKRISRALSFGTTTIECKSGYGLSVDSELKLLEINQTLGQNTPMDVHSTWLGAHDAPKDQNIEDYVDNLISEQLPAVIEQGIAHYADVFCEPGWFSLEQTEEIVKAAEKHGLPSRLHVDEFVDGSGLQLASELGVISGDHVGHSSDDARHSASNSGTMQTFLPGTPYILGHDLDSPLRKCVENNWQFSLATDFNPNCRSLSMPFVGSLATHRLGLSPLEALVAVTRNPASTLVKSSQGPIPGSIREGGPADFLILDSEHIDAWCQMPGDNPITHTVKTGELLSYNR